MARTLVIQRRRQLCLGTSMPKPPMEFASETSICAVDISNNKFNESVRTMLAKVVHDHTTGSLDFSHTNILGDMSKGWPWDQSSMPRVLQFLSARNTSLSGGVSFRNFPALKWADLSNNNFGKFVSPWSQQDPRLQYLDLRNNPSFQLDTQQSNQRFLSTSKIFVHEAHVNTSRLLCPAMRQVFDFAGDQEFLLPASSIHYEECQCAKGWGVPPDCQQHPISVSISSGTLPEGGRSVFGARGGQSAQWLLRPESSARAIT